MTFLAIINVEILKPLTNAQNVKFENNECGRLDLIEPVNGY